MKLRINQKPNTTKWSRLIKKDFDFRNGQGLIQLDLSHLFKVKDCENIYNNFNSNLNWIVRDSQKVNVLKNQVSTSKYLLKMMDFFRQLLQRNIPEKKHIHLILETLRVARSDGTQHQVGGRWHQDHEAYFSLLINLTDVWDPKSSTNFYHLEPNEKYNLDKLGNPVPQKHWKKDYIKPFHLGIINSGLRYFFFPFDKCRPIPHMAPVLNKRLAIFATFSISGIEQGMDLKDVYIPISKSKKNNALPNLRRHWRKILGIEKSIQTKKILRKSDSKYGLYKIDSIKFNLPKKNPNKKKNQFRIVNCGLKQFQTDTKNNKKLLHKAIPIGELSRSLNFFSKISNFSIKKLINADKKLFNLKECSLLGNNNYDLFIMFKQPKKAFQFLTMQEIFNLIDEFALILYHKPDNYIYKKNKNYKKHSSLKKKMNTNFIQKIISKKEVAQIYTSFKFDYSSNIKNKFLLSQIINELKKRGIKKTLINENIYNIKNNIFNIKLNNIDRVPFFLPRLGIDRKLPEINVSSRLIKLSKKILSKK